LRVDNDDNGKDHDIMIMMGREINDIEIDLDSYFYEPIDELLV